MPRRLALSAAIAVTLALSLLLPGCAEEKHEVVRSHSAGTPIAASDKPASLSFQIATTEPRPDWAPLTDPSGKPIYVDPQPFLTEVDIRSAVAFHGRAESFVEVEFTAVGAQQLAQITRANVGKRVAILLDGKVISAPRIVDEIAGGKAHISASFSYEEADQLAARLRRNGGR